MPRAVPGRPAAMVISPKSSPISVRATAVAAASPGPTVKLAATWQHLARYRAMAAAVAELLSPEAVTRTHQAAHHTIGALLARGQADRSFPPDPPAAWALP